MWKNNNFLNRKIYYITLLRLLVLKKDGTSITKKYNIINNNKSLKRFD